MVARQTTAETVVVGIYMYLLEMTSQMANGMTVECAVRKVGQASYTQKHWYENTFLL